MKSIALLIVLSLLSSQSFAQKEPEPITLKTKSGNKNFLMPDDHGLIYQVTGRTVADMKGSFSIDFDQDFFLDWIPNTNYDRNYSQGTAFSYTKYRLDESILFFPLNTFTKIFHLKKQDKDIFRLPASISMGVSAFTPRDIADSLNPVIGDRPFANVCFLSTTKNTYNTRTKIQSSTSFSYGIIGSNIGNVFQSYAHAKIITGRPTNIGWQYQISNGGHPAFLFSHNSRISMFNLKWGEGKNSILEGIIGTKVNIGWYTGIAAFTTIKFGKFSRYNSFSQNVANALEVSQKRLNIIKNLKSKGTNSTEIDMLNEDEQDRLIENYRKRVISNPLPNLRKMWDFYFFWTPSPRLTPYNSFLFGQPGIQSIYTLDKQNYNPFILDNEFGIFVSKLWYDDDVEVPIKSIDLILSIYSRTSEIIAKDVSEENPFQRKHSWGRVTLRFPLF